MAVVALAVVASASVPFNQRPIQQQNNRVLPSTERVQGTVKNKTRFDAGLNLPDGELKTYKRSGQYVYVKNGYLYRGFQTDKVDIIYAEDNVVYIKNILCGVKTYFGDDFWVQGTINDAGTEITVPLGQTVYTSADGGAEVVLGFGTTADDGNSVSCMIDGNAAQAVYAIDGERISFLGTSGLNTSGSYAATGLMAYWSDDESWTGFIECNTVLTETAPVAAPDVITEVPEDCCISTYAYRGGCVYGDRNKGWSTCSTIGKIDVAFADDGVVYLHNPMWWHNSYNTWVKGTYDRETGIISIPTGQYLAWSDKSGYGIQLKWGSTHVVENGFDDDCNPVYELRYSVDETASEIMFKIDGNEMYLMGCEGNKADQFPYNYEATSIMAVFSDNQVLDAMEYGINARELSDEVEWTAPETPIIYGFYVEYYNPEWGYFYFQLPEYDFNGNYMDPENLSYSIYVISYEDGTLLPLEFGPDIYYELSDWITEIPYEVWSQGGNFGSDFAYIFGPWYDHNIIGLQVHHTVNGVKYSSELCVYEFYVHEPTSTTELPTDKSVSSVRYYNVTGQEIPAPEGLTIQVTTFTDGTTTATKLMK